MLDTVKSRPLDAPVDLFAGVGAGSAEHAVSLRKWPPRTKGNGLGATLFVIGGR